MLTLEVARCFQSFIKKRRPQNGFFSLGEVALLGLERPCTVPPHPGDLLLYIEDLPFDQKLQTLIRRHAFFGLQALLALSTGLTVDLGAFPPSCGLVSFHDLLTMRFLAADERTVNRIRALVRKASPYVPSSMTAVGAFHSLGTLTLLREEQPVVDIASSLLQESAKRLYAAEIADASDFHEGMLDVADAL